MFNKFFVAGSRGFGFVNFIKGDDAVSAMDVMDGKAFLGRPVRISFALERVRGAPIVVPRVRSSTEVNYNEGEIIRITVKHNGAGNHEGPIQMPGQTAD
ncbi:hypothetical protein V2J09_022963 [Rumex salicifolius]